MGARVSSSQIITECLCISGTSSRHRHPAPQSSSADLTAATASTARPARHPSIRRRVLWTSSLLRRPPWQWRRRQNADSRLFRGSIVAITATCPCPCHAVAAAPATAAATPTTATATSRSTAERRHLLSERHRRGLQLHVALLQAALGLRIGLALQRLLEPDRGEVRGLEMVEPLVWVKVERRQLRLGRVGRRRSAAFALVAIAVASVASTGTGTGTGTGTNTFEC